MIECNHNQIIDSSAVGSFVGFDPSIRASAAFRELLEVELDKASVIFAVSRAEFSGALRLHVTRDCGLGR